MKWVTMMVLLLGGGVCLGATIALADETKELAAKSQQRLNVSSEVQTKTSMTTEDLKVTLGLKGWHTTLNSKAGDGELEASSMMYGAALNLSYKEKFYAGLSYYGGSGFDDSTTFDLEQGQNIPSDFKAEKDDLDLWFGYYFHPRASVFLGFKRNAIHFKIHPQLENEMVIKIDETYMGPVIGVTADYPIMDSGFILIGTLGYGFLQAQRETKKEFFDANGRLISDAGKKSFDMSGPAAEVMLFYAFKNLPQLGLNMGYKYQHYQNSGNSDNRLIYHGTTFGINYTF